MSKRIRPKGRRTRISCPPGLEVRVVRGKGRGVFATRRFRRGEVVESSPLIPMPKKQWRHIEKTILDHYVYDWNEDGGCSMVLGLGSLYNHSYEPNVENFIDEKRLAMDWIASRTIHPGEEVTVNYNDEKDLSADLWFDSR